MLAVPVVKRDSSEARYSASAATSSGVPSRPIGWRATNIASTCSSVWPLLADSARYALAQRRRSIVPGQMALQRTPRVMKSSATDLVRPMTAALVAA